MNLFIGGENSIVVIDSPIRPDGEYGVVLYKEVFEEKLIVALRIRNQDNNIRIIPLSLESDKLIEESNEIFIREKAVIDNEKTVCISINKTNRERDFFEEEFDR